jgi:hypothetical protein
MVSKILDITLNINFTGNINLSSFVNKNMETDGETNRQTSQLRVRDNNQTTL